MSPLAGCASGPLEVQWYDDGSEQLPVLPVGLALGLELALALGDPDCEADRPVHFWLLPPLHVQISTEVPLAVPAPVTSRQSPEPTPTIVPSELTRHCWLVPPLQLQISTLVPAVVARPGTSRHLLP